MQQQSNPQFRPGTIELLESRIAPASVLTFTDVDGDTVTVTSSRGNLQGHATFAAHGHGQQLEKLDLTDQSFANASLVFSVRPAGQGDGEVNVGFIDATGNDLLQVIVPGDLGRISVGDANAATPALRVLIANSMGQFGDATQGGGTGTGGDPGTGGVPVTGNLLDALNQLVSHATGNTGNLLGDVLKDASNLLNVGNLTPSTERLLDILSTDVKALTGALGSNGLDLTHLTPSLFSLLRTVNDDVADLTHVVGVDGDLIHNVLGGDLNSVSVNVGRLLQAEVPPSTQPIDLIDLIGLGGQLPAGVRNLLQSVDGSLGDLSGLNPTDLAALPAGLTGLVQSLGDTVGDILDGGTLTNGAVQQLGALQSTVSSLLALANLDATAVPADALAPLHSLSTEVSQLLGSTQAGSSGGGILGGGILGDQPLGTDTSADEATSVFRGDVGVVIVRTNIDRAHLDVHGNLNAIRVIGSIYGGDLDNSGEISVSGNLGSLVVGSNILGSDGVNSGSVDVGGRVGVINILGSLVGGSGTSSGSINLSSDANVIRLGGDIIAHDGALSGSVINDNGSINALLVVGSIIADGEGDSNSVYVSNHINSMVVYKGLIGDETHRIGITAQGDQSVAGPTDFAIRALTVVRSINHADIMLGYNLDGKAVNGSAQLAQLYVGGDFIASNLVAGASDLTGGGFGDADDRNVANHTSGVISRILNVFIRGQAIGTPEETGDHYGIEAEQIDHVFIGRSALRLTSGPSGDVGDVFDSDDFTIREVPRMS